MEAQILQGINQPTQPGVAIPDTSSTTAPTESNPYNASFWDWLNSVSGVNFYKNLFLGNPKGYGFWDFYYRDPAHDYSAWDSYGNTRLGKGVKDILGIPSADFSDSNALNDLPDELIDIFKQGLDLFNQNKVDQMKFNQFEADKNRAWQQYMSDTAYQRAMLDLKKAGINPLLAFGGGFSPASTPSGDSASASLSSSNSLFSSMASSILGDKKLTMAFLTALLGIFKIFTGNISRS